MSTPKPGQIRCPTCHRSTPPAAFCTQCGAPIPSSALIRPRGMDRQELDERIRTRQPGEAGFRRGTPLDEGSGDLTRETAYQPYRPEPEDALAAREAEEAAEPPRVDNLGDRQQPPAAASGWQAPAPPPMPPHEEWPERDGRAEPATQWAGQPAAVPPQAPEPEPAYDDARYPEPQVYEPYPADEQEDEYAYYRPASAGRGGGGGGGALPIIGFVALCVMALGVGAVLAGVFTGRDGTANTSPSATPSQSAAASVAPSASATAVPSTAASATPEPTDGPVAFPDGAEYTVHPCGTNEFRSDLSGCEVDGSTRDSGSVWVLIVFSDAVGSDSLALFLQSDGQTIDRQDKVLDSIQGIDCPDTCSGLIWGAAYQGLDPGEYHLVVRRNGEFADAATFVVEGG